MLFACRPPERSVLGTAEPELRQGLGQTLPDGVFFLTLRSPRAAAKTVASREAAAVMHVPCSGRRAVLGSIPGTDAPSSQHPAGGEGHSCCSTETSRHKEAIGKGKAEKGLIKRNTVVTWSE